MTQLKATTVTVLMLIFAVSACASDKSADTDPPSQPTARAPLSSGPGLAAAYPSDTGIGAHPTVIFSDDFESGALSPGWDNLTQPEAMVFVTDEANVFSGVRALQIMATAGQDNGGSAVKWFMPGYDRIFGRFCVKFAADMGYVHHFVHMMANRADDQWSAFGKAGIRPTGSDFFTTGLEPYGDWGKHPAPGAWHFYTYWPHMTGAPDGVNFWGNGFGPDEPALIEKDRWYNVELMVETNDVGQANGRQVFWVDGELMGVFDGFEWRTDATLKVNAFWLLFYVTGNEAQQNKVDQTPVSRVWFDNVVVAREYIGPVK